MNISKKIQEATIVTLSKIFDQSFTEKDFQINETKPEFEGDYTLVLFSLVKQLKKSPDELGNQIGSQLLQDFPDLFSKYNIIKGFLNLTITEMYWIQFLQ